MPANFARLNENVRLNQLEDMIVTTRAAIGEMLGTVMMAATEGGEHGTGNAVMLKASESDSYCLPVRLDTVDLLTAELHNNKCDLIKIDVEGSEFGCLKGGMKFISQKIPVIELELNYPLMKQFGWSVSQLKELVSPLG